MPLLRKKLIASIDNSLNKYDDDDICEIRDFNKIDSIFRYFGFTNKVITKRFYASGASHQIILPRDLQDIKDQINNGTHDEEILEFYKQQQKTTKE